MIDPVIELAHRKILRAMGKRDEIHTHIAEYATDGQAYEIVTKPDGKKATRILNQPPVEITLLVGELLYQVRSTLDQLFFSLVERNHGGAATRPTFRDIQFPICSSVPAGFTTPVPKDKFQSAARDCLSDKAFTFIEGLQPYYRPNTPAPNQMLWLLNKLVNIDKHRRVNVTVLRFDMKETAITPEGWQSTAMIGNVDDGTEIPRFYHPPQVLERAVEMKTQVIPRIAFNEPEISEWGPQPHLFDSVVNDLPTMVMGYIIPAFHHLYLNP